MRIVCWNPAKISADCPTQTPLLLASNERSFLLILKAQKYISEKIGAEDDLGFQKCFSMLQVSLFLGLPIHGDFWRSFKEVPSVRRISDQIQKEKSS